MNSTALVVTFFNSAGQGLALCIVAFATLRITRANASTSHAVWSLILAACFALPFFEYTMAIQSPQSAHRAIGSSVTTSMSRRNNVSFERSEPNRLTTVLVTQNPAANFLFRTVSSMISTYADLIVWTIVGIALFRLSRLVIAVRKTLLARERVVPISAPVNIDGIGHSRRSFSFASSHEMKSPCVLGFLKPIVVIPNNLLSRSPHELRAIVTHELAHVRRFDDVRGAVEQFVLAIAFFLPGIHISIRQLQMDCERVCDDAAVSDSGDRSSYAKMLAELAASTLAVPSLGPCLTFSRSRMLLRIQAILNASGPVSGTSRRTFALCAITSTALVIAMAQVHLPALAARADTISAAQTRDFHMHMSKHGNPNANVRSFVGLWKLSSCSDPHAMRLDLNYHVTNNAGRETWDQSECIPESQFRGISVATASSSGSKSFQLVHDAGSLQLDGTFTSISGSGSWTFVPSDAYAKNLEALGLGQPTLEQQYSLMMGDMKLSTLDTLARNGYGAISVDQLVRSTEVNADSEFLTQPLAYTHVKKASNVC